MKNWIIALAILIIPIIAYYAFDKDSTNKAAFEAQARAGIPTVIKFHSSMCLDCKKLDSVTKEIIPQYTNKINYQDYNVQNNDKNIEAMIQKYSVTLVPTMIFLKKDGTLYKKTEGYLTKEQLTQILKALTK